MAQPPSQLKTFLALGDSYTIGESVESTDRWPVQLVKALNEQGIAYAAPTIIATTGWRTDELSVAIRNTALTPPYNLVSLLIGVNNQFQGRSAESYTSEFEYLLKKAIELAGGDVRKVLVLSIPDYGYTPFGQEKREQISVAIDQFNLINKTIANQYGVLYVDITPISRKGLQDPELVAEDKLHPSGKMYSEWVRLILTSMN